MKQKFSKYQWAAAIGLAIVTVLLTFGMIFSIYKKGIESSDAAGWVQAAGSIGAILGAVLIARDQHEKSLARDRKQLLERQLSIIKALMALRDEASKYLKLVDKHMRTKPHDYDHAGMIAASKNWAAQVGDVLSSISVVDVPFPDLVKDLFYFRQMIQAISVTMEHNDRGAHIFEAGVGIVGLNLHLLDVIDTNLKAAEKALNENIPFVWTEPPGARAE